MQFTLLWISDLPQLPTGFGRTAFEILRRIGINQSIDVHILALGASSDQRDGARLQAKIWPIAHTLPEKDEIIDVLRKVRPNAIVTLSDIWTPTFLLDCPDRRYCNWIGYFPIDCGPLPSYFAPVLEAMDRRVTTSEFSAAIFRSSYPSMEISVIPHGVDSSVFRPGSPSAGKPRLWDGRPAFVVGCVARNQSRKALPVLCKAFALFARNHDDAFLHLHTNPWDSAGWMLPELLKRYGIEERTSFTQPMLEFRGLSDQELCDVYRTFDIFALPTMGEGFGIPILEAMACGIPVVATDCSAVSELIAGRGIAIPPRGTLCVPPHGFEVALVDPIDLKEAFEHLYSHPEERAQYAMAGRTFAETVTWDRAAEKWIQVLEDVCQPARVAYSRQAAGRGAAVAGSRSDLDVALLGATGIGIESPSTTDPVLRGRAGQDIIVRRTVGPLTSVLNSLRIASHVKERQAGAKVTFATSQRYASLARLSDNLGSVTVGIALPLGEDSDIDLDNDERLAHLCRDIWPELALTLPSGQLCGDRIPEDLLETVRGQVRDSKGTPVIVFQPCDEDAELEDVASVEGLYRFIHLATARFYVVVLGPLPVSVPASGRMTALGVPDLIDLAALLSLAECFIGPQGDAQEIASALGVTVVPWAIQSAGGSKLEAQLAEAIPGLESGDLLAGEVRDLVKQSLQHLVEGSSLAGEDTGHSDYTSPRPGQGRPERSGVSPLTSIVILNCNTWEECTRDCVQAVRDNTTSPYEIILLDNGSNADEVKKIVAEMRDACGVRIVLSPENLGYAAGCNRALSCISSQARLICFLHSDCLVLESAWNQKALAQFERDPRLAALDFVAGHGPLFFDASSQQVYSDSADRAVGSELLEGGCIVVDAKKVHTVNFDPAYGFVYWETADLCFRLRQAGWRLAIRADMDVLHLGSRTISKIENARNDVVGVLPSESLDERNRLRFVDRWQGMLHDEEDSREVQRFLSRFYRPRLSVVARARYFDHGTYDRLLGDLRDQDLEEWELIIVADSQAERASLRESPQRDQRLRIVVADGTEEHPLGSGLSASRATYVAIADPLTRWLPPHFAVLCEQLDAHPDCDGVVADPLLPITGVYDKENRLAGTREWGGAFETTCPFTGVRCRALSLPSRRFFLGTSLFRKQPMEHLLGELLGDPSAPDTERELITVESQNLRIQRYPVLERCGFGTSLLYEEGKGVATHSRKVD